MADLKVGAPVTVVVDPGSNNGVIEAHGRVTKVNDDGTVNVLASCDTGQRQLVGVSVHGSRSAVTKWLDEQLEDVPDQPNDDNTGKRKAVRTDVLRWAQACYTGSSSTSSSSTSDGEDDEPSAEDKKTPAKKTAAARKSTPRKRATATVPRNAGDRGKPAPTAF